MLQVAPVESTIAHSDRLAAAVALVLGVGQAVWLLGPMAAAPGDFLVGSHIHPDNLANQWLLPWAVDTFLDGGALSHTLAYYWPVGDRPLLSGDGTQAVPYALLHLLLGWPAATPAYVGGVLVLNSLAGWFAARTVSRDGWAALLAVVVCGWSPFVLMELSAGRFAQAAVWPLLLFVGVWWRYLEAPGPGRALVAAGTLFCTTFSYWYYGWFGVVLGALAWLVVRGDHTPAERRVHWRWHGLFAVTFLLVLAPYAAVFVGSWAAVPGAAETLVFPPDSAHHDRLSLLPALSPADPTTTAAVQSVLVWVLAGVGAAVGWRTRGVRAAVVVGGVFLALGWGPAFSGAPYTLLYGLAAPLRRFWWPVRHVVVVQAALAVLAAVALAAVAQRWRRRPVVGGLGALAVGASLWAQGAPRQVEHTPLTFPTEAYARLATLPEGAVAVFPIAPEATGTNDAMLHQLAHGHPMVMGHSPWVARARPPEWDAWLAEAGLLARMAELERGGSTGERWTVTDADLSPLRAANIRWLVLDRTLVPLSLKAMVRSHDALLDGVFGRPVIRTSDVQVWDVTHFTGPVEVSVPAWSWPDRLQPAGPEWPLAAKRPASPMLGTPSGAPKRTDAAP